MARRAAIQYITYTIYTVYKQRAKYAKYDLSIKVKRNTYPGLAKWPRHTPDRDSL